jgi:LPS export ABC transporter protein LptC
LSRCFAWIAAGLLLVSGGGCKKAGTPENIKIEGEAGFSQVLRDFQMQDILNGSKNMVLESVEGRFLDKDRSVDVDKPRVTFFKEGAASSVLTAPKGRVGIDSHEVLAWGGVMVVTPDSTTLTTDRLRYNPQSQRLVSEDPVQLERPDSITKGIGLEADPGLNRVRIGRQKVYVKPRKR